MAIPDDKSGPEARILAVALKYANGVDPAPKISAAGRGAFAEQLIELALANGVKIRKDADLAQILTAFDVDSVIPVEALDAVAEILAYVYRVNGEQFDPDGTVGREWANALNHPQTDPATSKPAQE